MRSGSDQPLRVPPDESASGAAFDRGSDEVARTLATTLVDAFRRRR